MRCLRPGPAARPVLVIAVSLLLATAPADAQVAPDEALIQQGLGLRRERRDAEALAQFQRAHALQATPRALAQIGLAEQALGRWTDADAHLRAALGHADDPWIRQTRPALEDALRTIARQVGRLELLSNVAGAEVRVDGRTAGALPLPPVTLPAGVVTVQVRAEGYQPLTRRVIVVAGESMRETVDLTPVAPPARPSPPALGRVLAEPSPPAARVSLDGVTGVGVARVDATQAASHDGRGWVLPMALGVGGAVLIGVVITVVAYLTRGVESAAPGTWGVLMEGQSR